MIKEAELDDLYDLHNIARSIFNESWYSDEYEYDLNKVDRFLKYAVESSDFVCLIARRNGKVLGGLLVSLNDCYFTDVTYADEHVFYVEPECRVNGRVALELLKKLKHTLSARGITKLLIGTTTKINTGRTEALYKHLGCEQVGSTWKLDL